VRDFNIPQTEEEIYVADSLWSRLLLGAL
ncbi:hypothetical protein Tco_0979682, partial [Tanacetum coccineum]